VSSHVDQIESEINSVNEEILRCAELSTHSTCHLLSFPHSSWILIVSAAQSKSSAIPDWLQ
jgi:hypothetical protein